MSGHVCDTGCRDHAEASRVQALGEVEQLLEFRYRAAWDELAATGVVLGEPTAQQRTLWARMNATLDALQAVQAVTR